MTSAAMATSSRKRLRRVLIAFSVRSATSCASISRGVIAAEATTGFADGFQQRFLRCDGCSGGAIRSESGRMRAQAGGLAAFTTICTPNGTNRKQCFGTKACDESSITPACYLCNTHPKTVRLASFQAHHLLRVHVPSVIVMLRRRGGIPRSSRTRWFA